MYLLALGNVAGQRHSLTAATEPHRLYGWLVAARHARQADDALLLLCIAYTRVLQAAFLRALPVPYAILVLTPALVLRSTPRTLLLFRYPSPRGSFSGI